jgi:hypothetical protein
MKTYSISELFHMSWSALATEDMAIVIEFRDKMKKTKEQGLRTAHGYAAITMLRALRKNKSLVSKINVDQAVDCINDISFFEQPWFFFPKIGNDRPADFLKDHLFIQLYYIDSLLSKFLMQHHYDCRAHPPQDISEVAKAYLDDVIGVIYTKPDEFDESKVVERGKAIGKVLKDFERVVIIATYANVKEFIINECPDIFPTSEAEPSANAAPVDTEPMWQALLFDLSETKAYPGMDKAKRAPMYEALSYLEKKHKDHKPKT